MKCSIRNIVLPPAPKPTRPMRVYTKSEKTVPKRFEDENMKVHPLKNGRDPWEKDETKTVLEMWQEGHSVEEIAKMLGRTTGSVESKINRERIKGRTSKRRSGNWKAEDTETLLRLVTEGKSTSAIAKEMHVSQSTIQKHLKKEKEKGEKKG